MVMASGLPDCTRPISNISIGFHIARLIDGPIRPAGGTEDNSANPAML